MRNSKEIQEEFNELNDQLNTLFEKDGYTDEEYNTLNEKLDILAKELKRVKLQEERNASSLAGAAVIGGSERQELSIMANNLNFSKSCLETKDTGKKTGLEAEVQSIADAEKEASGITTRNCYQSKNILATIPGIFIKYGPHDPRLNEAGKLNTHTKVTVATEGTDVVETDIIGVSPALSVTNAALEAGATVMPNQVGDLQIAKGSSLTMSWEGETDADADAGAAFTNFSLAPKRLGGKIPISWQMLKQSSFSQIDFWKNQMEQYIGSTLDAALFHGATDGPTGIDSESGVSDYSPSHSPGEDILSWDTVVNLEGTVGTNNALKGNLSYVYPSKVSTQTKTKFRNTGTSADQAIMDVGMTTLNSYPTQVSNNIVDDYTTDNDKAYIFFGNFQDLIVAFWGGVDILENPFLLAGNATTVLHSNLYVNGGTLNGESFVFANNILIT